jgi:RimJ/RimL family protein N-acetyltransferase
MNLSSITLTGRLVRLEPLDEAHIPDLAVAGRDEIIWRYMPYGLLSTAEKMAAHVKETLAGRASGKTYPFAVILLETGRAVGSTSYLDIQLQNRALEIGGTWYAVHCQRSGVNTECKYLLLCHAFETLNCLRVQFKTDLRNEPSQRALERIGAVREGVLRKCLTMPDGYQRSSVYYSVLDNEWPAVKTHLEQLLAVV